MLKTMRNKSSNQIQNENCSKVSQSLMENETPVIDGIQINTKKNKKN